MLFFLIAGHALMDYSLQGEATATCKCRKAGKPLQQSVPWYYWLSSHALTHGLAVGAILSWYGIPLDVVLWFAMIETLLHFIIDYCKCEGWYGQHFDQALHVLCKFGYWSMLRLTPISAWMTSTFG